MKRCFTRKEAIQHSLNCEKMCELPDYEILAAQFSLYNYTEVNLRVNHDPIKFLMRTRFHFLGVQ